MTPRIRFGEVGKKLVFDLGFKLTGYTVQLEIKGPTDTVPRKVACSTAGNTATRTTAASDFPVHGTFYLRPIATKTGSTFVGKRVQLLVEES